MKTKLPLRGKFHVEHWRGDTLLRKLDITNGITDEGYNTILNAMFNDATSKTADWVIGLINASGFSALADADTMSSHAGWTEFTTYSEGTRPEWNPDAAASQAITNATLRDFNISSGGTLKGIFISSNATKGGTTGFLWSTALFAGDIPVSGSDLIKIAYTVSK